LFLSFACTNEPKPAQEVVEASADEGQAADVSGDEAEAPVEGTVDSEFQDESAENLEGATLEDFGDDLATAVTPAPLPSTEHMMDTEERVVRYVIEDTPTYMQADEKGMKNGDLLKAGDSVVVAIHGDWAEINANHHMKMSTLSQKMVPHKRVENWRMPAR